MSGIWLFSSRLWPDVRVATTRLLLLMVITLLGVAGCTRSEKWTEDVLLPDGRVVTLTRYQEFGRRHEIGQPAGPSFHWFTFKHPSSGEKIYWEDSGDLGTVALFVVDNHPYLLTKPYYLSSLDDRKCPNPPYVLLRYDEDQWREVDLLQIPLKRLRSNLTYGLEDEVIRAAGKRHHLTVEQTQSALYQLRPWIMNFAGLTKQTFDLQNCSRERDYRIVTDSVKEN